MLSMCFVDMMWVLHFQDAALDADKVYMAAIDKFDAMMSRSKAYAPHGMT